MYAELQKKRLGRRIRWTVVLVPFLLVFIGLSTRYLSHPAALDVLSSRSSSWASLSDWTPHKRHAFPDPAPAETSPATTIGSSSVTGTSLTLASASLVAAVPATSTSTASAPWYTPQPVHIISAQSEPLLSQHMLCSR